MTPMQSVPARLSLLCWCAFLLYWSAAAKNASRAVRSESKRSRRLHLILLNAGLLLTLLPIRSPRLRLLPHAEWIGLSLQVSCLALAVWARRHLGLQWSGEITTKLDHTLIRSGPYRFVRHPIYTAMLGMLMGSAVVSGHIVALLGLLVAGLAYWRKIRLEEANLTLAFGADYKNYQRETGALLPRLGVGSRA